MTPYRLPHVPEGEPNPLPNPQPVAEWLVAPLSAAFWPIALVGYGWIETLVRRFVPEALVSLIATVGYVGTLAAILWLHDRCGGDHTARR